MTRFGSVIRLPPSCQAGEIDGGLSPDELHGPQSEMKVLVVYAECLSRNAKSF